MKYFEIESEKEVNIVNTLMLALGQIMAVKNTNDLIDYMKLDDDIYLTRNNKTEFINEIDSTLNYYELISSEWYSLTDNNEVRKHPDNTAIIDINRKIYDIIDIDTDYIKFKDAHISNEANKVSRKVHYLNVIDSTNVLCIDMGRCKGILAIRYNNDKNFNFDVFPSINTNRTVYYISIDNSAVTEEPYNNYYKNKVLLMIESLFDCINIEPFNAACIYNGYFKIIPLIVFEEYLINLFNSGEYALIDGIIHRYAEDKFHIPNFLEFYDNCSNIELPYKPCGIIKFLIEQERLIHKIPVMIFAVQYSDWEDVKILTENLHKAMSCAIVYEEDITECGREAITDPLNNEDICAIFIIYSDKSEDQDLKEFAISICDRTIDLNRSDDKKSLRLHTCFGPYKIFNKYAQPFDSDYTINIDGYTPYNLLNLLPEIKAKFDSEQKNGIPKTIEEYKAHPMGNPVPMIIDEPVKNEFMNNKQ